MLPIAHAASKLEILDHPSGLFAYSYRVWPPAGDADEDEGSGPIEMLTIPCAALLGYRLQHSRRGFKLTLAATAIFAAAFFGIWLGLIHPVNSRTASWTVATIPPDWEHGRNQWEYSHALRFVLPFGALALPVHTALTGEPQRS